MTDRIPEIRARVERAISYTLIQSDGTVYVSDADVRYLLSALTARDALLKRCAEMLRKHDRCDHDGQGFDETCPECHAFMDTDPHLESCPYSALMREIEDAK